MSASEGSKGLKAENLKQVHSLQRRAYFNVRRHFVRSIARFVLLVTTDTALLMGLILVMGAFAGALGSYLRLTAYSARFPDHLGDYIEMAGALILALSLAGNYGAGDRRKDLSRLAAGCLLAVTILVWQPIWSGAPLRSLAGIFLLFALYFPALIILRGLMDWVFKGISDRRPRSGIAILIGDETDSGRESAMEILQRSGEYKVLGFVHPQAPGRPDSLGSMDQLPAIIGENGVDTVLIYGNPDRATLQKAVEVGSATRCRILAVESAFELAGMRPTVIWIGERPVVQFTQVTLEAWQYALKRFLDIFASLFGLMILSPLFVLIAIVIRLDSKGPVFFRQPRVGRAGKIFNIVKFRSMEADAEARFEEVKDQSIYSDRRLFKATSDPRVTRVGDFLRRSSLDELPQLINVMAGDMSLVGPRPPLPSEVDLYEEHHYARFDVKPGMTGPWQVGGRNEIVDFEDVVRIETDYIRNWSLMEDLQILIRTIPAVLSRRGAH